MTLYRAFYALLLALAVILGSAITTDPAQAATCTTVWLTAPSFNDHFEAGTRSCIQPDEQSNGWIKINQFDGGTEPVTDWIPTWGYTTTAPNNGLYEPHAYLVRRLARQYDVRLQFAYKARESVGCTGIWAGQVNGTYYANPGEPGKGLIRIGTGKTSTCMRNRDEVMNTAKHEVAHAVIERKCPNIYDNPRYEYITDAYAYRYMATTNRAPGNYGFTTADLRQAINIMYKRC